MKKLMIATAAMAIVGTASAVTVYDYRATVKHPYVKEVKVGTGVGASKVYAKFLKTTTITGYLIQDEEATLNGGRKVTGQTGRGYLTGPATVTQPENRCFLVAYNSGAGKYAYPRIIPGIIEAKWYNPSCKVTSKNATYPVQAYLWLGGEVVDASLSTDQKLLTVGDNGTKDGTAATYEIVGHKNATAAGLNLQAIYVMPAGTAANTLPAAFNKATAVQVWNYAFTSQYLFGQFNNKTGTATNFADCWLNGAAFGTCGATDNSDWCCGWGTGGENTSIVSCQGNLKGGIWLCSTNGDDWKHSHPNGGYKINGTTLVGELAPSRYEQQLWSSYDRVAAGAAPATLVWLTGIDARFEDLWVDGPLALTTTDCASGTWSLRRVTKNMTAALDFTGDESSLATANIAAWSGIAGAVQPSQDYTPGTGFNDGTLELLETIKGCMLKLNKNAKMVGSDTDAAPNASGLPKALFGPTFFSAYLAQ